MPRKNLYLVRNKENFMRSFYYRIPILSLLAVAVGCGAGNSGSSGPGTPVTFTFAGAAPTVVALQTGSSFVPQSLQGGKLSFTVPSGTKNYTLAYGCARNDGLSENVVQASTLDGTSFTVSCGIASFSTTTGSVDATAIPG